MANIDTYFPSGGDWLKAEDITGPVKATIKEIKEITVPDFNDKSILLPALEISFVGADKVFICKKMNGQAIAAGYGRDTNFWIGKKIVLKRMTFASGKEGLAAEPDVPVSEGFGQAATPTPAAPTPPLYGQTVTVVSDEDIPW